MDLHPLAKHMYLKESNSNNGNNTQRKVGWTRTRAHRTQLQQGVAGLEVRIWLYLTETVEFLFGEALSVTSLPMGETRHCQYANAKS